MKNKKILSALISLCIATPLNYTIAMNSNKNNNIKHNEKNININNNNKINNLNNEPNINLNNININISTNSSNQLKDIEKNINNKYKNPKEINININHEDINDNIRIYKNINNMINEKLKNTTSVKFKDQIIKNNDEKFNKLYAEESHKLTKMKLIKYYCKKMIICAKEIIYGNPNKSISINDYISTYQIIKSYIKELNEIRNKKHEFEQNRTFIDIEKQTNNELMEIYKNFRVITYVHKILKNYLLKTNINNQRINEMKNSIEFQRMNLVLDLNLVRDLILKKMNAEQFSEEVTKMFIKEIFKEINRIYINLIKIDKFNLKLFDKEKIYDMHTLRTQLDTIKKDDIYENAHIKDIEEYIGRIKINPNIAKNKIMVNIISYFEACLKEIKKLSLIKENTNLITNNIKFGKEILNKNTKFKDIYKTLRTKIIKKEKKINSMSNVIYNQNNKLEHLLKFGYLHDVNDIIVEISRLNVINDKNVIYKNLRNIENQLNEERNYENKKYNLFNEIDEEVKKILDDDINNSDNKFSEEEKNKLNEYVKNNNENESNLKSEEQTFFLRNIENNFNETYPKLKFLKENENDLELDKLRYYTSIINGNIDKIKKNLKILKLTNRKNYNEELDKEIQDIKNRLKQVYTLTLIYEINARIKAATTIAKEITQKRQFQNKDSYDKRKNDIEDMYSMITLSDNIFIRNEKKNKNDVNIKELIICKKVELNKKMKEFIEMDKNLNQTIKNREKIITKQFIDKINKNNEKNSSNFDPYLNDKIKKLMKIKHKSNKIYKKIINFPDENFCLNDKNNLEKINKNLILLINEINNIQSYIDTFYNTIKSSPNKYIKFYVNYFKVKIKNMYVIILTKQSKIYLEKIKKYLNIDPTNEIPPLINQEIKTEMEKLNKNMNSISEENKIIENLYKRYKYDFILTPDDTNLITLKKHNEEKIILKQSEVQCLMNYIMQPNKNTTNTNIIKEKAEILEIINQAKTNRNTEKLINEMNIDNHINPKIHNDNLDNETKELLKEIEKKYNEIYTSAILLLQDENIDLNSLEKKLKPLINKTKDIYYDIKKFNNINQIYRRKIYISFFMNHFKTKIERIYILIFLKDIEIQIEKAKQIAEKIKEGDLNLIQQYDKQFYETCEKNPEFISLKNKICIEINNDNSYQTSHDTDLIKLINYQLNQTNNKKIELIKLNNFINIIKNKNDINK